MGQKKPELCNGANKVTHIYLKAENQQILLKKLVRNVFTAAFYDGVSEYHPIKRRKSLIFFGVFFSTFLSTILQRFSIGFRSGSVYYLKHVIPKKVFVKRIVCCLVEYAIRLLTSHQAVFYIKLLTIVSEKNSIKSSYLLCRSKDPLGLGLTVPGCSNVFINYTVITLRV